MGGWRAQQQSCGAKQPELSHDAEDALQTPENAHHGKSSGVGTLCPHVGASLVLTQRQTSTNRFPKDNHPANGCITSMENEKCPINIYSSNGCPTTDTGLLPVTKHSLPPVDNHLFW